MRQRKEYVNLDMPEEEGQLFPFSKLESNVLMMGDEFLQNVYELYRAKGLINIVYNEIGKILMFLIVFTVGIAIFPTLYDHFTSSEIKSLVYYAFLFIFEFKWLYLPISTVAIIMITRAYLRISKFVRIRRFYKEYLKISPERIPGLHWRKDVLQALLELQKQRATLRHQNHLNDTLSFYNKIMRSDNYMISLLTHGLITSSIHIPLGGPVCLPQTFYDTIRFILFGSSRICVFNSLDFLKESKQYNYEKRTEIYHKFRRSLLLVAIAFLFVSIPFLFYNIMIRAYILLISRLVGMGNMVGYRLWSPAASLELSHYNELEHQRSQRLNSAIDPASDYLSNFPNKHRNILEPFMVCVGVFITSIIVPHLFIHQNLATPTLFASFVFYMMYAIYNMVPDKQPSGGSLTRLVGVMVEKLIYIPTNWEIDVRSPEVRETLNCMLPYKLVTIMVDMLSPILTPVFLMWHRLNAHNIVDHILERTLETNIGPVLDYASFDGDSICLPPASTCWGKKPYHSIYNFSQLHPDWAPSNKAIPVIHSITNTYRWRNLVRPQLNNNASSIGPQLNNNFASSIGHQLNNNFASSIGHQLNSHASSIAPSLDSCAEQEYSDRGHMDLLGQNLYNIDFSIQRTSTPTRTSFQSGERASIHSRVSSEELTYVTTVSDPKTNREIPPPIIFGGGEHQ